MARVQISPQLDVAAIAVAAGQPDPAKRRYAYGELTVDNISQSALDAAVAAYDPLIPLRRAKRKELILAFDADYEALWSIDGEVIEAWKDRILFKTAANRTAAENNKLTQAAALFDKLQTKLAYLKDPVRTEVEVNALTWASTP